MPAPRLVERVGEGGAGAFEAPGEEVNEILRGVTDGSARSDGPLSAVGSSRCAGVSYYGCSRGSGVGSPHANNALAAA